MILISRPHGQMHCEELILGELTDQKDNFSGETKRKIKTYFSRPYTLYYVQNENIEN